MSVVVITGANRGIGLELTKKFLSEGDNVIALCRQSSEELRKTQAQIIEGVDVTDFSSIEKARKQIKEESIDILINNAGVWSSESLELLNERAFEKMKKTFDVNTLGPLRVTSVLLEKMNAGGKIAVITSRMGSIADNTSGGRYSYRFSKAAVNAAFKSLAIDLAPQEISVALLHPGFVQTDMTDHQGDLKASGSAQHLYERIKKLSPQNSGTFWHCKGEVLPW